MKSHILQNLWQNVITTESTNNVWNVVLGEQDVTQSISEETEHQFKI